MRASRTTLVRASFWASSALLGLASCQLRGCEDSKPITYVDILDRTLADETAPARLDRKQLEAAIAAGMKQIPGFEFRNARGQETKWQLDVRVGLLTERSAIPEGEEDPATLEGKVRRAVMIGMRLHPLAAGEREYAAELLHAKNVDPTFTFDQLAAEAVGELVGEITFAMKLEDADEATLLATLDDENEKRRLGAMRLIAQNQLRAAVPKLSEIVRDEEEKQRVVLAAIGALVAIGDPEAVPVLIDAGRRRPPSYLAQILFAIAQLGGRDAKGYLFTVQSGYPDEALREVARQALEELEAREAQQLKTSPP
ncbi:MAG: HEAT repeat domain-containing protein [Deltaproteobacteria bacterium]